MTAGAVLAVRDLTVELRRPGTAAVPVVEGLSFEIGPGEGLGLVGESGTGKSVTVLALAGLLPAPLRVASGSSIVWRGRELAGAGEAEWREIRGSEVGLLFQDPGQSLDPLFPVGEQVAEVVTAHGELSGERAMGRAAELLERAGFAEARQRLDAYPHQLSGGELQRVALAAALAGEPELILGDEPTASLDAPVAADVLDLLAGLRGDDGTGLLMVSHDLGAVARACGRVAVLYAGRLVEEGPAGEVLGSPSHPYTRGLLAALPRRGRTEGGAELEAIPGRVPPPGARPDGCRFRPRCRHAWEDCGEEPPLLRDGRSRARCWLLARPGREEPAKDTEGRGVLGRDAAAGRADGPAAGRPLLEARGLRRTYGSAGAAGVRSLDLSMAAGGSTALVGRSGSGKSTAARLLLRLERPDAGELLFRGRDAWALGDADLMAFRRAVQPVFQHPGASLNPRRTVGAAVREPLEVHGLARGREARRRASGALERVGLDPALADRYPHELSGGECQRAVLARALMLEPRLLLADEPTSALDVSVQAAILNLLAELRRELGLGLLLISHDLAVVRHVCDRVVILHGGEVVERGTTERIFRSPENERTRELVEAAFAPAEQT